MSTASSPPFRAPRRSRLSACAVALGLAACSTIGTAPKGSPRIEVEVAYEVDAAFTEPLYEVDLAALGEILRDAVRPLSDVGLRFYPVPSENYRDGQRRPDYLLTVHADRLEVDRKLETRKPPKHDDEASGAAEDAEAGDADVEEEEAAAAEDHDDDSFVEADVRSVACAVEVRFERRRSDAPNLIVGEAVARSTASTRRDDPSRAWRLKKAAGEVNDTAVTSDMIERALRDAATRALGSLQKSIDRELQMLGPRADPE